MKRTAGAAALLALTATAALAAPPVATPGALAPRSAGPNFANYPEAVACPQKVQMDVTPYALPKGWNSYGIEGVFQGVELSAWQGKDELHCHYATAFRPDDRITTLRLQVEKGACVIGPGRGVFRCKAGTPH